MTSLLEKLFPIRAEERRLAGAMFFHNLFAVGAFIAGRSVRDALFLAHVDAEALAWMYIISALMVALLGVGYTHLAPRFRQHHLASGSALIFAVLFVLAYLRTTGAPFWFYPLLYVYVEVMGALALVQFWTLLNELFHAREARRLYGVIGAGGMVANIIVGLATRQLAQRLGAPSILLLCAGLLAGSAVASGLAGRWGRERLLGKLAGAVGSRAGGAVRVWRSGHLRMVAILSAVTFLTTTLVDFEFKVSAARTFGQDRLAAYFGAFYAVVGVLALALQLFGTTALLNRVGVTASLAVLPAALLTGNVLLAVFGTLATAALAKGADSLFRYSVNDATTQLLYLPVPGRARTSAKAFIDGVVKSGAIAAGGLFLFAYRALAGGALTGLAWFTVVLCLGWGLAVWVSRSHYLQALQENLRKSRTLPGGSELELVGIAHDWITGALRSADPSEVLGALELLPQLEAQDAGGRVEPLLAHASAAVRTAALGYFAKRGANRDGNAIYRLFEDPDPTVRACAIETFCTLGKDKAIKSVRALLADPEPAVRSAAIVGMIRFGGLDGVLAAAEALKALIAHEHSGMRQHAAKVLGSIGVQNFYQPVLELMNDPEPAVRRQAIRAAGQLKSQEFVIPLIYKTPSPETGGEAIAALSSYGEEIVPTLAKVLGNPLEEIAIRRSMARVLGGIASPAASEILLPHLGDPDEELRTRLCRALTHTLRGRRAAPADRRRLEAALELELLRAYRALAAAEVLGLPEAADDTATGLLVESLNDKIARAEERIFLLLEVLHPNASLGQTYNGVRHAAPQASLRRRAAAAELLDNLLARSLRRKLVPLIEEIPRAEKLSLGRAVLEIPSASVEQTLQELARDPSGWLRACALHYAALKAPGAIAELLPDAAIDPEPVVRETALLSAVAIRPGLAASLAQQRLEDESPVVRLAAQQLTVVSAGSAPPRSRAE